MVPQRLGWRIPLWGGLAGDQAVSSAGQGEQGLVARVLPPHPEGPQAPEGQDAPSPGSGRVP